MKEKDIHNLIEKQDPEVKQRIIAKVHSRVDLAPVSTAKVAPKPNILKRAAVVAALIVVIVLSVVLPVTLKDSGDRFCSTEQYFFDNLDQSLREYSISNNKGFLLPDRYSDAYDVVTFYAYMKEDKNDIVFWEESITDVETGIELVLSITDNKTKVDKFEDFDSGSIQFVVDGILVTYKIDPSNEACSRFQYGKYVYFLRLYYCEGQEQMAEIVEEMLKSR